MLFENGVLKIGASTHVRVFSWIRS